MNTKLLRQKILDLAIRGKLTEQKKSDGTTKDLLASIAASSACHAELVSASPSSSAKKNSKATERSVILSKRNASKDLAKEIIPLDKSEAPFEIPENWEWVRLGDLMEKVGAGSTPTGGKKIYGTSGIKFIRSQNVHNDGLRLDDVAYIDPKIHEQKMHSQVVANDLLLNITGASIGRCAIVPNDFDVANINQHVLILRLLEKEMLGYVHTVVISNFVFSQIMSAQVGGTKEGLSAERAKALEIPLPPLAEQKRIVEAIESAFAEITAIENNQELLKKHIKQGRQKILDLAIRGKLTEQKKSDGTTKDLLTSIATASACHAELVSASPSSSAKKNSKATERSVILSKRSASKDLAKEIIPLNKDEAPFEIPENWEWVKLGDLSEKIQYGYNAPAKGTGRIKMVRITDIHDNAVEWDSVPFCDIEESEIPTYLLKKNDILFARTGGTVGKSFIVNEVPEDAVYAGYLIRTRYGKNINAQYMKYFMESNLYWVQLREGCIATAQPNCNGQTLGKMRIPLPPLAEQQRIVAAIESAFTEFDAMEKI